MIFHAHCASCRTSWRVVTPDTQPVDLAMAVECMEKGLCPTCGNNGGVAPVRWRWRFGGDVGITKAEVRKRREAVWTG